LKAPSAGRDATGPKVTPGPVSVEHSLGSTSAEVLKLALGLILIAAAFKAFWGRS
jgi:hypothetical protein